MKINNPVFCGIFDFYCFFVSGIEPKAPIFKEWSDYKNSAFRLEGEAIPAGSTEVKEKGYPDRDILFLLERKLLCVRASVLGGAIF